MYAFDLHTWKSNKEKTSESSLGLGGKVVVGLLQIVEKEYHAVYLDNFFVSFPLLFTMTLNTMLVVQCEKIALQIVLLWIKKLLVRKKEDGTSRGLKRNNQVCFIRWNDIQTVTVGSNFLAVYPVGRVSRFSRRFKLANLI